MPGKARKRREGKLGTGEASLYKAERGCGRRRQRLSGMALWPVGMPASRDCGCRPGRGLAQGEMPCRRLAPRGRSGRPLCFNAPGKAGLLAEGNAAGRDHSYAGGQSSCAADGFDLPQRFAQGGVQPVCFWGRGKGAKRRRRAMCGISETSRLNNSSKMPVLLA